MTRACEPFAYTGWLRPEPNDVRLMLGARDVRRDDVDVMPATTRFAREEMNVLADPAQVRIVVLRDQRDAKRPLVALDELEIGQIRESWDGYDARALSGRGDSRAAWAAARRAIGTR